jgi:hypothetical protein
MRRHQLGESSLAALATKAAPRPRAAQCARRRKKPYNRGGTEASLGRLSRDGEPDVFRNSEFSAFQAEAAVEGRSDHDKRGFASDNAQRAFYDSRGKAPDAVLHRRAVDDPPC